MKQSNFKLRMNYQERYQMKLAIANKIKAALIAVIIQAAIAFIFFVCGLLDPLLMVYFAVFYFLVIGSFLMYRFVLTYFIKNR